jgi:hypothetical protein
MSVSFAILCEDNPTNDSDMKIFSDFANHAVLCERLHLLHCVVWLMQDFIIHRLITLSRRLGNSKTAGQDRLRPAAYFSGTAGSSGSCDVTFVLRMLCLDPSCRSSNKYTSTQCVLVSASQCCRPLGGEYPIGDSWQPLISGSNSKKVRKESLPH